jgi:hypothetical protein
MAFHKDFVSLSHGMLFLKNKYVRKKKRKKMMQTLFILSGQSVYVNAYVLKSVHKAVNRMSGGESL